MEQVLFYGVPQGCSLGSIIALEWLGEPYHLSRIEMMEHPWPALYARVNAQNLTPALLTVDNRVITQSAAILLHLAARNGHLLGYAPGTPEHDRLAEMLAYLNTEFFSAFYPLWMAYEMEANPPVQDMLRGIGIPKVKSALARLDGLLATREWIDGGAKRTVADAYFAATARWAEYHAILSDGAYPHLAAHLRKLRADPAVAFAHAIEDQLEAASAGRFMGHLSLEALEPRLPA